MEKNKDKSVDKETSSDATIQRGQEAIKAEEKANQKNPDGNPKDKEKEKKDAEQWRNEG